LTVKNAGTRLRGVTVPKQKHENRQKRPSSSPVQSPAKETLERLYARLEKTKPGSEESKRIAGKIVDAIG